MDNKTTVILVSVLAAILAIGGTFFYVKDKQAKAFEAELFSQEVALPVSKPVASTPNVADLTLPAFLKNKAPVFIDDFNNLDNWIEEDDFEFNQWAITTKGHLVLKDGTVTRDSQGNSGLKLKNYEIDDGAVAIRVRVAELPDKITVGGRIMLRNSENNWCYGVGVNVSTYGYELANWHGKGNAKTSIVAPAGSLPQLYLDQWATITAVIEGNTVSYYLDGELIAENTDDDLIYDKGGIFITIANYLEIDKIAIWKL